MMDFVTKFSGPGDLVVDFRKGKMAQAFLVSSERWGAKRIKVVSKKPYYA